MLNVLHMCIFFIILSFIVISGQARHVQGKALFCRDPDTGKLHAVNSSWPATSFCGNYTCKLRKSNSSNTESKPLRQFKVPNINANDLTTPRLVNVTGSNNGVDINAAPSFTIETRVRPDYQPIFHKLNLTSNETEIKSGKIKNDDRYLTEKEIKAITELLHGIKKSDLDALVEVYNVAQEIYNEMEKTTGKSVTTSNFTAIDDEKPSRDKKGPSYWYEPLHLATKYKPNDIEKQSIDIASNVDLAVEKPHVNKLFSDMNVVKTPYYIPVSDFQRQSSYQYSKPKSTQRKSCRKSKKNQPAAIESTKIIHPSILLPYPFSYIPHYNLTYPGNLLQNNNPLSWNGQAKKDYEPFVNQLLGRGLSSNLIIKPHSHKTSFVNPMTAETVAIKNLKEDDETNWKTGPLPSSVIEEIKANIDKKIDKIPVVGPLNLEKVGKVIKLDEFLRSKRDLGITVDENMGNYYEDTELQVDIEKIVCQPETDTRPGFFRVGDLSQPYPECCPQRIDSGLHTTSTPLL